MCVNRQLEADPGCALGVLALRHRRSQVVVLPRQMARHGGRVEIRLVLGRMRESGVPVATAVPDCRALRCVEEPLLSVLTDRLQKVVADRAAVLLDDDE